MEKFTFDVVATHLKSCACTHFVGSELHDLMLESYQLSKACCPTLTNEWHQSSGAAILQNLVKTNMLLPPGYANFLNMRKTIFELEQEGNQLENIFLCYTELFASVSDFFLLED